MTAETAVLIPILVLGIVMVFAFAGCGTLLTLDDDPETQQPSQPPAQDQPKPPPIVVVALPTPPPADAYPKLIMQESGRSLRSYWRFGETPPVSPGVTKAMDYDRNTQPQDGVYHGGVTLGAAGVLRLGSDPGDVAAQFNGTDAYVEFPYNVLLNPLGDFTIEAWIRPDAKGIVVASYTVVPVVRGFVLEVVDAGANQLNAQVRVGEGSAFKSVSVSLGDGTANDKWRYVVATHQVTTAKVLALFVNAGNQTFKEQVPHDPPLAGESHDNYKEARSSDAPPLRIGAGWNEPQGTAPGLFFKGRIDEVAIYDKVLLFDDPVDQSTMSNHYKVATSK